MTPTIPAVRPVKNHIGVSGGKDSTALLLWAVHESGYDPETLDVTFCDTGNEHVMTYAHVEMLSKKVCPIEWLKGKRDFFELVKAHDRFPSPTVRFCTKELKIRPTQKHIKKLVAEGNDVVMHSGIRSNESFARSKLVKREELRPHVTEYRPLLQWTIAEVWAIHARYGIPPNPLYELGAKRVGCFPCIMSRKLEIARAFEIGPTKFDKIREYEGERRKGYGWNTFFEVHKTPMRFRSKKFRQKDGSYRVVATIDDVVRLGNRKAGRRAVGALQGTRHAGRRPHGLPKHLGELRMTYAEKLQAAYYATERLRIPG